MMTFLQDNIHYKKSCLACKCGMIAGFICVLAIFVTVAYLIGKHFA